MVRCRIRVGAAVLPMDGIAGVHTEREQRNRGFARKLLQATVDHLRQGDGALTMLYGIPDFYHRFGYVTAGPEQRLHLTRLDATGGAAAGLGGAPSRRGGRPAPCASTSGRPRAPPGRRCARRGMGLGAPQNADRR